MITQTDTAISIFESQNWRCAYCGAVMYGPSHMNDGGPPLNSLDRKRRRATLDHVLPVKYGGTRANLNLVGACRECNSSRRDVAAIDWYRSVQMRKREGMSQAHLRLIRKLPSCISGRMPCEAHHLCGGPAAAERGVGMKATDKWVVPLTPDEHRDVHTFGSKMEGQWFMNRGIDDVYELAAALWDVRGSEGALRTTLGRFRKL